MGKIRAEIEKCIQKILDICGLDGMNFHETPRRFADHWLELLSRPKPDLKAFPTNSDTMVVLKGYTTWGLCPHHLLPVRYTFRIGYVPRDKVLGLSKLARLADWTLSKLPIQEDIPKTICDELEKVLNPLGVGCQVRGWHMCSVMRGVKANEIELVTTCLKGVMLYNPGAQQEFLNT